MLPVAVDSPMGVSATRLYSKHHEDHDFDMHRIENLNGTHSLRETSASCKVGADRKR